jgi:hypothetical protein
MEWADFAGSGPITLSGPPARTPYGDWLGAVFDRCYREPRPPVRIAFFESVLDLLLGGVTRTETIGGPPSQLAVVDTDGSHRSRSGIEFVQRGLGCRVNPVAVNASRHADERLRPNRAAARHFHGHDEFVIDYPALAREAGAGARRHHEPIRGSRSPASDTIRITREHCAPELLFTEGRLILRDLQRRRQGHALNLGRGPCDMRRNCRASVDG